MKVIPQSPGAANGSSAERRVFQLLSEVSLPDPKAVCFHSLRLSKHPYKRSGEIDFLIVTRRGLYVLEVKGGRITRGEDGIWQYTDRFGDSHSSSEGPFKQAESAMFALKNHLRGNFGAGHPISEIKSGFGVVFPHISFNDRSPEWSPETVLDNLTVNDPENFKKYLRKLIAYWDSNSSSSQQLAADDFEKLLNYLRPKFDLVQSLASEVRDIEERVVEMTLQQYKVYECVESNDRIICDGGAGTGKTLVAADIARRHAENGLSVFFLIYSPPLAAFVKQGLPSEVTVSTTSDVAFSEPYDVLIIDEAQDLINFEELGRLDKLLKGGLEHGVWRIFLDKNNQLGISGNFEPAALELLKLYHPARITLKRNCRNTQTVITQVEMITSADVGEPTLGVGPLVRYIYADDEKAEVIKLKEMLFKLLNDDVIPCEITILSEREFEHSAASKLPRDLTNRIEIISTRNPGKYPCQSITFSSIKDFKGLENKFIIITDLNSASFDATSKSFIYVGMTRAKAGLIMIILEEAKKVFNKMMIRNFKIINQDT